MASHLVEGLPSRQLAINLPDPAQSMTIARPRWARRQSFLLVVGRVLFLSVLSGAAEARAGVPSVAFSRRIFPGQWGLYVRPRKSAKDIATIIRGGSQDFGDISSEDGGETHTENSADDTSDDTSNDALGTTEAGTEVPDLSPSPNASSGDISSDEADTNDQDEADIIHGYYEDDAVSAAVHVSGSKEGGGEGEDSSSSTETETDDSLSTANLQNDAAIDARREAAVQLRIAGKEEHDVGNLENAAETFRRAADELEGAIESLSNEGDPRMTEMVEEGATCRLHEALCHLKRNEYALCIQACSDVLDDGVQVVPFEDGEGAVAEDEGMDGDEHQITTRKAAVIRITPNGGGRSLRIPSRSISPAARGRAYHRRAKARLALGDSTGALEDAKTAAFLGDRNAVSLYGRLMREASGDGGGGGTSETLSSALGSGFMANQGAGGLSDLLGGNNPFFPSSGNSAGSDPSAALLGSLLNSAGSGDGIGSSPFGGLASLLGAAAHPNKQQRGNGGGMDGLAKSLLKNLAKRIDDENTQKQICRYLNNADSNQLKMYASMAGVELPDGTAEKISTFANGVTPKGLRKGVRLAKRGIMIITTLKKVAKVIAKYRHLIVFFMIGGWIKSSLLRPVPIDKKQLKQAAKAARTAAKASALPVVS